MRFRFDRYLNPASVIRQSVMVTSGMLDPETGDPKGPTVFFEPVYDPYERLVVFLLPARVRWTPTTLHTVKVYARSEESQEEGFRSFDDKALMDTKTYSFMTGHAITDPDNDVDEGRPVGRFCDEDEGDVPPAFPILRKHCGTNGCHDSSGMLGLDLSHPDSIRNTAIRVVARQTMTGPSVSATSSNPERFGVNMPRLDPGNPGNSYVIYKLLVNPNNHPAPGQTMDPPDPWLGPLPAADPAPAEEITQLRHRFVRGEPMPPEGQLMPKEMRSVIRWLLSGAATPSCTTQ
jgi:hypothetical protein